MKFTRRQLAALASVTAVARAESRPQTAGSADELGRARERLQAIGEALDKQAVPMDTEPAFQFKV